MLSNPVLYSFLDSHVKLYNLHNNKLSQGFIKDLKCRYHTTFSTIMNNHTDLA